MNALTEFRALVVIAATLAHSAEAHSTFSDRSPQGANSETDPQTHCVATTSSPPQILLQKGDAETLPLSAEVREKLSAGSTSAASWVTLGDRIMQKSRDIPDDELYGEARRCYEKALETDARSAEAMVGLAWVHNTRHEFTEGGQWAKKALAIEPQLPLAHALIGDAAVEFGNYDEAFEHYQEALDMRPDLGSYSRAAHLLWLTGDTRRAQAFMRKAIAAGAPHAENTAWCRAQLAMMSFQTGALMVAEREVELALKEAPKNHNVLAVAARIKLAKKEYEAAIDLYRRVIDQVPSLDGLAALGDLYALTGQPEEAERQYRRLIETAASGMSHTHGGSKHAHPHGHGKAQLAKFYADHDRDLARALEEAKLAWKEFPNVFVTDTLAWCYYKAGLIEEAKRTIARALKWKTPSAEMHFHAGMIYTRLGDRSRAQMHLYKALNLNPHFHPFFAQTAADTLKTLAASFVQASEQTPQAAGAVDEVER